MKALTCEEVRELLPAPGGEAGEVTHHLAGCAECRAEAALLASLRASAPAVPAALEQRVLGAVRARPLRRAWAGTRQLALAATLAAAVIGGGLVMRALDQGRDRPVSAGSSPTGEPNGGTLPVLEDPAVYGGSALSSLTEAELESLLNRMGS